MKQSGVYSAVKLRKYLPDRSLRFVVSCYRIEDQAGFARFFLPHATPRVLRDRSWTPDGISIAAIDPSRDYVVHWSRKDSDCRFYVDASRSVELTPAGASYVDLLIYAAPQRSMTSLFALKHR